MKKFYDRKNELTVLEQIEKIYQKQKKLLLVYKMQNLWDSNYGVFLQESKYWEKFIEKEIIPQNNCTELYFEESDIEWFVQKLESLYPKTVYVNRLMNSANFLTENIRKVMYLSAMFIYKQYKHP